ncbi:MAG: type IIA DNA topoisomerase subunit B [bacterium]|uniref:DNA topoisomerase (ATP-hydrolyzing) n=1 Tax=Candidatus Aphodosoma intestinipullorum TaxID=2840674 RepID=A0A940DJJ0_9BACT|nr:type IIA DNA topoisomerase subunit B [Candidatus Aphodosoma intestinipullorum]
MAENSLITESAEYSDDNIVTLEGLEHVRRRAGMYIGKLGDGSSADDGIYVLTKEVIDNSIDEFRMKFGNLIEIRLTDRTMSVRDYGRGIPQGKMIDAVSKMNTGGKYDDKAFKKSVGLNGVGTKAVNALSSRFIVMSFRDGMVKRADFERGKLVKEYDLEPTTEKNGTFIEFTPDCEPQHPQEKLFDPNYAFREEFIESMLRNYSYLNPGLTISFNGKKFVSKNGLLDLLNENNTAECLYPIVHLKADDIEIAFTHTNQYGEDYYSFVNGQHTIQGGTHQSAFREAFGRTIKEFYNKNGMELSDIRNGFVGAISVSVQDPVFESQTKIKLGSKDMAPGGPSVAKFIGDFVKKEVDNYLHKNPETADILLKKIQESESERKAIAGVTKLIKERTKKTALHNTKLRDCRIHYNDARGDRKAESSIFITEGDSASGSITKVRDVATQAVFPLRGKVKNSYKKPNEVYTNEELAHLQVALNIVDGLEGLRYNKVIIATDADVDGKHIRLLLMTFFLKFYPELVQRGHVYILQTPLFRVRNKKETRYCYTEAERLDALASLGANPEITRFKGLGEISPDEFKRFIGSDMRLDQVTLRKEDTVPELLSFYMGDNTSERKNFIVDNLVIDEDEP